MQKLPLYELPGILYTQFCKQYKSSLNGTASWHYDTDEQTRIVIPCVYQQLRSPVSATPPYIMYIDMRAVDLHKTVVMILGELPEIHNDTFYTLRSLADVSVTGEIQSNAEREIGKTYVMTLSGGIAMNPENRFIFDTRSIGIHEKYALSLLGEACALHYKKNSNREWLTSITS